ncbi:MAG: Rossman fold protein, TIGR00730 family [Rhizobiales bacterium PAR1]|nr:MAG: Rossman fold protein, TIGR00730 family [Rhizobiales bacterium PAR1]
MTAPIRAIAVFSGSNFGGHEAYAAGAKALGSALAQRGITVVYGGTNKGLMGVLADAALAAGGRVHGVITERLLAKGHAHPGLTISETAADMRMRKKRMAELADAFIALPGGIGTLEEFMEIWTLNQLGDFAKPAGLLDIRSFYQPLMGMIDHMIAEKFLPAAHRDGVVVEADPVAMIDKLVRFEPVTVAKWL